MPRGFKESRLLIVIMTLFVNNSEFLKREIIYLMTHSVAHYSTWDYTFALEYARGDVVEHTNGKCHVFTFQYTRGRCFGHTGAQSIICVHFSQLVDHCVT